MYDFGHTAFMLIAVAAVAMMTPALALLYAGLSRKKNVINVLLMTMMTMSVVTVLWFAVGHSLAFGGADAYDANGNLLSGLNLFVGGLDMAFANSEMAGITGEPVGGGYPGLIDIALMGGFAMVTTAIIVGSLVDRVKFSAMMAVAVIWPLLVFAPLAHMVWGGGLISNVFAIGAIDIGGGIPVHIASGVSGLVLCLLLGPRRDLATGDFRPHSMPMAMVGIALLFLGWFVFNGSAPAAPNGMSALAFANTLVAGAAGMIAWSAIEYFHTKKITMLGAIMGLLAGLVVSTPTATVVAPWASIVMGVVTAAISYWFCVVLKAKLGYDDSFDVFGCHGVCGSVGLIFVGLFTLPGMVEGKPAGLIYSGDPSLLLSQLLALLATWAYVVIVVLIIGLVVKAVARGSLRVAKEVEEKGLDEAVHGESAYAE